MGRRYYSRSFILERLFNAILVLKEIEEEDTRWEESRKKQPNEKESIFPSSRPAKPPHKEEKASQPEKRNTPSGFY